MEPGPVQRPAEAPAPTPAPVGRSDSHALALRISVYYLLFGLVWVTAADWAVHAYFPPGAMTAHFQTVERLFFVILTAGLLFLLVSYFIRSLQRTQQALEEKLHGIAEQYQRLFDRSPAAMIIFDGETRRIYAANDVSLLLYGYSRQEMLSMTTLQLLVEEERPRAAASPISRTDTVQSTGPWQVRRRDGRIIFVEAITHVVDFNGKPARIAQVSDITDRLQNERALAQYRTQLEYRVTERTAELSEANRRLRAEIEQRQHFEAGLRAATTAAQHANESKSTFLANTSHEIRTPLTSILGYADLLADASLPPDEQARYVRIISQNAQHMLALIDDLLDLSRVEMGKVRVTFDDHATREIAHQAVELLRPRASEVHLTLLLQIHDAVPEAIRTDGVRLRQILFNLLNNAIKFTPAGSVTLSVSTMIAHAGVRSLRFDVTDTGIGMSPDHLERVFEPFYQIEQSPPSSPTRAGSGSGLGLAISRQLAAQMGGELAVSSTVGKGTTFSLSLPMASASEPASGSTPAPALQPMSLESHILLAEDTPNIRLLVTEYLTRAGARVTSVANGAEAVRRVQESTTPHAAPNQAYDLILLDFNMPVMGGPEALQRIRALGYAGPVVGLTADYNEITHKQWAGQGWDAMAAKPIDRQAFIPLIARLVSESQSSKVA